MQFKNTREFLDKINTVYYAMVALPLVLFLWAYLNMIGNGGHQPIVQQENIVTFLQVLTGIVYLICIYIAYSVFRKNIFEARLMIGLTTKLQRYYSALLIKNAVLAGTSLVVVLVMYLTGNNFFILMFLVVLVIISLNRPSVYSIINSLKLNKEEREVIIKNNELLD